MSQHKKRQYSRELNELQSLLKQEITLCQEILSQMSQQEYFMLIGELEMCDQMQADVQILVKQLKLLQKKRKTLTKELIEQALPYHTLPDLLEPTDEADAEMLIFLEKYKTLVEKITDQEKRNHSLQEMIQKEGALDPTNPALRSQMIYDSKSQKPLLITIDYPDEKSS